MNTTHPSAPAGTSQCDLILARLQRTPGEWVPMPALVRVSGSYVIHSRIADLRKRGHRIDHRNKIIKRKCHSEYRLAELAPPPMPYQNCGSGQDYGVCTACGKAHGHIAFQAEPSPSGLPFPSLPSESQPQPTP